MPGHQHTGAQADPVDKAGEQKDQTAGRPHRGQGFAAQEVAHDEGVHRVVQLLEQIAEKDGHRKHQHAPGHAPLNQGDLPLVQVHHTPCYMITYVLS